MFRTFFLSADTRRRIGSIALTNGSISHRQAKAAYMWLDECWRDSLLVIFHEISHLLPKPLSILWIKQSVVGRGAVQRRGGGWDRIFFLSSQLLFLCLYFSLWRKERGLEGLKKQKAQRRCQFKIFWYVCVRQCVREGEGERWCCLLYMKSGIM